MQHPWTLLGSVVAVSPLIWLTFQYFFPTLWENLQEDRVWLLLASFTDFSVATWTVAKFLYFVVISAAYVYLPYKIASLLFL
jgi:hypothetical protein